MKAFPALKFGKYKGKTLDQCPIDYLEWMVENMDFEKYKKSPINKQAVLDAITYVKEQGGPTPEDTNTGPRWDTVSQRLQKLPKEVREFEMKHHPQQGRIEFMDALCDMVEAVLVNPSSNW